jgi:amino acid transporter
MEQEKHTTPGIKQYMLIAFLAILSCFLLFSVDKDTHSFNDLLKLGNLAALVVYFIPTFLVSIILLKYFSKKKPNGKKHYFILTYWCSCVLYDNNYKFSEF